MWDSASFCAFDKILIYARLFQESAVSRTSNPTLFDDSTTEFGSHLVTLSSIPGYNSAIEADT